MKHIVGFALLIVSAASCSPQAGRSQTSIYSDDTHGFRLRYPREWKRVDAGGNTAVLFTGDGTNRQITVSCEEGSEKEIAAKLKHFRDSYPDYKELEARWISMSGRRAYWQTVQWSSPLGDIKACRLWVPAGDHFFTVSATTQRKEFVRYAPLLRSCVLSFEVTRK